MQVFSKIQICLQLMKCSEKLKTNYDSQFVICSDQFKCVNSLIK